MQFIKMSYINVSYVSPESALIELTTVDSEKFGALSVLWILKFLTQHFQNITQKHKS